MFVGNILTSKFIWIIFEEIEFMFWLIRKLEAGE